MKSVWPSRELRVLSVLYIIIEALMSIWLPRAFTAPIIALLFLYRLCCSSFREDLLDRFPRLNRVIGPYPYIIEITPCVGDLSGGDRIAICGKGLHRNIGIMFGDNVAELHDFVDSEFMVVITPPTKKPRTVLVTIKDCDPVPGITVPQLTYRRPFTEQVYYVK